VAPVDYASYRDEDKNDGENQDAQGRSHLRWIFNLEQLIIQGSIEEHKVERPNQGEVRNQIGEEGRHQA